MSTFKVNLLSSRLAFKELFTDSVFNEQSSHPFRAKTQRISCQLLQQITTQFKKGARPQTNGWIKSLGVTLARTDWIGPDSFDITNSVSEWRWNMVDCVHNWVSHCRTYDDTITAKSVLKLRYITLHRVCYNKNFPKALCCYIDTRKEFSR